MRLSRMICFFLYKNLMFGVTIFIFNAITLFSGQYMWVGLLDHRVVCGWV